MIEKTGLKVLKYALCVLSYWFLTNDFGFQDAAEQGFQAAGMVKDYRQIGIYIVAAFLAWLGTSTKWG